MLSDFVSLPLSLLSFLFTLLDFFFHICLSTSTSITSCCLSLFHLLLLQLCLCPFISCFYSCPSSTLYLFLFSHISSLTPTSPSLPITSPSLTLFPHISYPMACLPLSPLFLSPSIRATILLLSQLRSQLFPASAPAFPWRGSPPLPRAPSFPRFGGQPADVAQHLLLLHRQGEVMSRLASPAQSECVRPSL